MIIFGTVIGISVILGVASQIPLNDSRNSLEYPSSEEQKFDLTETNLIVAGKEMLTVKHF